MHVDRLRTHTEGRGRPTFRPYRGLIIILVVLRRRGARGGIFSQAGCLAWGAHAFPCEGTCGPSSHMAVLKKIADAPSLPLATPALKVQQGGGTNPEFSLFRPRSLGGLAASRSWAPDRLPMQKSLCGGDWNALAPVRYC